MMKNRIISNWKSVKNFIMPKGDFVTNTLGKGRRFLSFSDAEFREEAFAAFGIYELYEEPLYKNFIGNHYLDGAFTHLHKDHAPDRFLHVRCNWLLKKPIEGGNIIIGNKEIQVNVGDLWICFASEEIHGTTPIKGGERMICSFGALVPKTNLDLTQFS